MAAQTALTYCEPLLVNKPDKTQRENTLVMDIMLKRLET